MRSIINGSLRLRVLVSVIAIGAIFFGVIRLNSIPVNIMPEYGAPVVRVQTEALGLSPTEVEQFITAPLEQDLLNGVAFLENITSSSVPGLSVVDMEFQKGTDIFVARQVVQERLTQAHALPNVSTPPQMVQPVSSTGRVMMIGMTSEDVSLIDMSLLARWTIKSRLVGVPGVSNVSIWGMRDQQLQILVDPAELHGANVSLRQLVETSANALWTSPLGFVEASTPGTGGWIENANQRMAIQHELPINSATDLARVFIGDSGAGSQLVIGDVAEVVENHQPLIGDAAIEGAEGLMIVIEKFPWANAKDVTRELDLALDELRPGLSGITLDASFYRPADFLSNAMGNLGTGALLGAMLALVSLIVLVRDPRVILVNVIAIPFSIMGTVIALAMLGQSLNVIMLVGLAAALFVVTDRSVSDTHDICAATDGNASDASTMSQIAMASAKSSATMVFVVVIMALVLVPVVFMSGVAGALFQPIVWAYIVATVTSFVIAVILTPVISWYLFSKFPGAVRTSGVTERLRNSHGTIVAKLLQSRTTAGIAAIGLAALALILMPVVKPDTLLPRLQQSVLLVDFQAATGTSMPEVLRLAGEVTTGLKSLPGIEKVGAHVGRSLVGDQIVSVNSGQIWAAISADADYDATVAMMGDVIAKTSGITAELSAYANSEVDAALAPAANDLTVRLYGPDPAALLAQAESVRAVVSGVDGVGTLTISDTGMAPAIEIEVMLDAAAEAGITPGDVRRTASILLSGLIVGQLFDAQKVFDVVVWGKPEIRQDVESIKFLLIDTPSGTQVALGDVANVEIVDRPEEIRREASSRFIDISGDVAGRDLAAVEADIQTALRDMAMPYEYHAAVRSTGAEAREARSGMVSFVIAAVIGVMLVLQAAVTGWIRAVVVAVALLASVSGAMIAALLIGNVSLAVYAGLLATFGLAVSQSLAFCRTLFDRETQPGATFDAALVGAVAQDRFAPVLITSVAMIAFFCVFLFAAGSVGYVLLSPFAVVVLLGVLTTLLTNLVLLPALCLWAGPAAARDTADAAMPIPGVA